MNRQLQLQQTSGSSGKQSNSNRNFLQNLGANLSNISHMVVDTLRPGSGSSHTPGSHFGSYSERESALAESLEAAQQRIVDLVKEMESNHEAQMIVLETKESVLRSLARQNTHLAMEVK